MPQKLMLYRDTDELLRHLPTGGTASTSIPRELWSRQYASHLTSQIRRSAAELGLDVKIAIEDVPGFPIAVIVRLNLPE